jgi:hypothetical protein
VHDPSHPTAILRQAWSQLRLDAIREVVEATIVELCAQGGHETPPVPASSAHDPTTAALLAVCAELREGSGLPQVEPPPEAAGEVQPPKDAAWESTYAAALERYRGAAGAALTTALGELSRGPETSLG